MLLRHLRRPGHVSGCCVVVWSGLVGSGLWSGLACGLRLQGHPLIGACYLIEFDPLTKNTKRGTGFSPPLLNAMAEVAASTEAPVPCVKGPAEMGTVPPGARRPNEL